MLCRICGSPIKEGERFCSLCGEKAEATEGTQQNQPQQSYGQQLNDKRSYSQQPDNQQPYRQQSYGREDNRQSYRQSYRQQFYEQQSYGQPGSNLYYSVPTKSKKWLWITLSFVAVLAIAAALILFVKFGDKQAVISHAALPFKGDTPQTKFANDTAKVFSDAFDVFENIGIDLNELAGQPFDMKLDMTMKIMGREVSGNVNMAYDNETLGVNINAGGASVKALLIDDVMYMDVLGNVYGLDFNSAENLSQPMTLKDRMMALGPYFQQRTSSIDDYSTLTGLIMQNMLSKGEYTALAEFLLNSIDESCFENSGSRTILTLHADDAAGILRTFAKKLDADEELKKMYKVFIKESLGISVDAIKQVGDAADALEEQKETSALELVWEVSYKNEKPVAFKIKADDGYKEYVYSYGYEQNGDSTDVTFQITPGSSSASISGTCNFKKAGSGTEFVGTIIEPGQALSIPGNITVTFYGNIAFSGNNAHGTITVKMPDALYTANGLDVEESIDFNLTVNIGMPAIKVKDDGRFNIDTGSATIIDAPSLSGIYGLSGAY